MSSIEFAIGRNHMGANYDRANSDEKATIMGADMAREGAAKGPDDVVLEDYLAKGRPSPKVIDALVARFRASREYAMMREGYEYFRNRTRIDGKKRTLVGEGGAVEEYPDDVLSNSKVKHPDFPTMVRQKKAYLMSRPFSIRCEDKNLQKVLEGYFDEGVRATLKEGLARATYSGKCPFEVYYDPDGRMRVSVRRPTEVIPYWADEEHTELVGALRTSSSTLVRGDGTLTEVVRYCFYNGGGVYRYVRRESNGVTVTEPDPSASFGGEAGRAPHFYRDVIEVDAKGEPLHDVDPATGKPVERRRAEGMVFSRLPILFFKYNSEEESLLTYVKPLVDEYDDTSSQFADEIKDTENSIKVIKGYNGENLGELVHNLKLFRAVTVQSDGDVSAVTTPIAHQAYENHLTRVRKDMYSAGSCVDTTRVDNLGNQSGIAMRYIYSDLDMTCMEMWDSLEQQVLKPLVEFFLFDYYSKNPSAERFGNLKVDFIPNTDIAVNETETISNIKNSVGVVSNETLLANHPYVTDVTAEMARVKKEREEAMRELAADGLDSLGGSDKQPKEITSRRNGEKSQG